MHTLAMVRAIGPHDLFSYNIHTHIYIHTYIYLFTYTYICMYKCTHWQWRGRSDPMTCYHTIHIHTYIYIYIHLFTYSYIYMYKCIRWQWRGRLDSITANAKHTDSHRQTYTHTYVQMQTVSMARAIGAHDFKAHLYTNQSQLPFAEVCVCICESVYCI